MANENAPSNLAQYDKKLQEQLSALTARVTSLEDAAKAPAAAAAPQGNAKP
jgi:hypothetical protein